MALRARKTLLQMVSRHSFCRCSELAPLAPAPLPVLCCLLVYLH